MNFFNFFTTYFASVLEMSKTYIAEPTHKSLIQNFIRWSTSLEVDYESLEFDSKTHVAIFKGLRIKLPQTQVPAPTKMSRKRNLSTNSVTTKNSTVTALGKLKDLVYMDEIVIKYIPHDEAETKKNSSDTYDSRNKSSNPKDTNVCASDSDTDYDTPEEDEEKDNQANPAAKSEAASENQIENQKMTDQVKEREIHSALRAFGAESSYNYEEASASFLAYPSLNSLSDIFQQSLRAISYADAEKNFDTNTGHPSSSSQQQRSLNPGNGPPSLSQTEASSLNQFQIPRLPIKLPWMSQGTDMKVNIRGAQVRIEFYDTTVASCNWKILGNHMANVHEETNSSLRDQKDNDETNTDGPNSSQTPSDMEILKSVFRDIVAGNFEALNTDADGVNSSKKQNQINSNDAANNSAKKEKDHKEANPEKPSDVEIVKSVFQDFISEGMSVLTGFANSVLPLVNPKQLKEISEECDSKSSSASSSKAATRILVATQPQGDKTSGIKSDMEILKELFQEFNDMISRGIPSASFSAPDRHVVSCILETDTQMTIVAPPGLESKTKLWPMEIHPSKLNDPILFCNYVIELGAASVGCRDAEAILDKACMSQNTTSSK